MSSAIECEQEIIVGRAVTIECPSPVSSYSVVFEDDGETGYFYALQTTVEAADEQPILDALHIYNVESVTDRSISSSVQIVWSEDGLKSALVINRYPHAVLDFESKRGYCRTGFPPPSADWSAEGHDWKDSAIDLFK